MKPTLTCPICLKSFSTRYPSEIRVEHPTCSRACSNRLNLTRSGEVSCAGCGRKLLIPGSRFRTSVSKVFHCSRRCQKAATARRRTPQNTDQGGGER